MKKILMMIMILSFISSKLFGQLSWVGDSYVVVNLNNSGIVWYNGSAPHQVNDFDGFTFNNVLSLKLGGEVQSWAKVGDVATLSWAIKSTGGAGGTVYDSGTLNLPLYQSDGDNHKWQEAANLDETIDITKLSAGTTYYLHVWFYVTDNDAITTVYDSQGGANYVATINTDAALPVELITFTALTKENKVILDWETATEVNNFGFDVERKSESEDWKKIGFVEGHGNSNSPKRYTFVDNLNLIGQTQYRLKQVDIDGSFSYSSIVETVSGIPSKVELLQNFPNPFNPITKINFSLNKATHVSLTIFNVIGEKVIELINQKMEAGKHTAQFDASKLNSGIYIYKLQTEENTMTKKMLLLK